MMCAVQPECFCTQRELTFHHSSPRARRFVVLAALGRAGVGLVLRTSSSQPLESHDSRAAYARLIGARSEDAAPQLEAACNESWAPQGLTVAGLTCLGKAYPALGKAYPALPSESGAAAGAIIPDAAFNIKVLRLSSRGVRDELRDGPGARHDIPSESLVRSLPEGFFRVVDANNNDLGSGRGYLGKKKQKHPKMPLCVCVICS